MQEHHNVHVVNHIHNDDFLPIIRKKIHIKDDLNIKCERQNNFMFKMEKAHCEFEQDNNILPMKNNFIHHKIRFNFNHHKINIENGNGLKVFMERENSFDPFKFRFTENNFAKLFL